MTYAELTDKIRDLGFSDDDEMEEFGELVPNAINQAISEIETYVAPIKAYYELEIPESQKGLLYIDMSEEDPDFLDFDETPVQISEVVPYYEDGVLKTKTAQYYQRFADFDYEGDSTIIINADAVNGYTSVKYHADDEDSGLSAEALALRNAHVYNFRIYYKKLHTKYTGTAEEQDAELELPLKVHFLVPLLAAYYVWLEDEPTKAAQYYNLYEQTRDEVVTQIQTKKFKVKVLPGGM